MRIRQRDPEFRLLGFLRLGCRFRFGHFFDVTRFERRFQRGSDASESGQSRHLRRRASGRGRDRQLGEHPRACIGRRFDQELAAHQGHTLDHFDEHGGGIGVEVGFQIDIFVAIFDLQRNHLGIGPHVQPEIRFRRGMLDLIQRFLHNAVERRLQLGGETAFQSFMAEVKLAFSHKFMLL